MPIRRTRPNNVSVSQLKKNMDKLSGLIDENKAADGSVDMPTLKKAVRSHQDNMLKSTFEGVQQYYRRQVLEMSPGNSSGIPDQDIARLDQGEVKSVMSALISAKMAVTRADKNQNGSLDAAEAKTLEGKHAHPDFPELLGANVADAAVKGAHDDPVESHEDPIWVTPSSS